jgi:hypothetical protein
LHISTYAELVLVLIELILLKLAFDEPVYNDILFVFGKIVDNKKDSDKPLY